MLLGAVIGDIVGSVYEFDRNNIKTEDFVLFTDKSHYTDDTIMTVAIIEALISKEDKSIEEKLVEKLRYWGKKYPYAGYGSSFYGWLYDDNPEPYNSWGNGSAMRVSAVGWMYEEVEEVLYYARKTAEVTHNHPEGIKGAESVALCIYLARKGYSKEVIKEVITRKFGYDLDRTIEEIRPNYRHVESCQESVPEAIIAYLEGNSFEDVLRKAISLGGDSDTIAAIACSIAEASYDIPMEVKNKALTYLPKNIIEVLLKVDK